jgi:hypothetical protein
VEIAEGIIRMLTYRLREADATIEQLRHPAAAPAAASPGS